MKNKLLKNYFDKNKLKLKKMYPGIRFSWLENDFNLSKLTIDEFIMKLEKGIPLEHISGQSFFYNHSFIITPDVLIPRSETEILVEKAVYYLAGLDQERINVADVGTGSGNIILSIMTDCNNQIYAVATDISIKALEIARRNYIRIETGESKLNFIQTDRLKGVDGLFDLIVSNPPYIKEKADKNTVHKQVLIYEPHVALFLKDLEYDTWFKDFFLSIIDRLKVNGLFLMEGHENHLKHLGEMAKDLGFAKVEILPDYNGKDRFLKASKE